MSIDTLPPLTIPTKYHVYRGDEPPLEDIYDYIIARNGIFKRAETEWWKVYIPVAPAFFPVRGLKPLNRELFSLKVPKIPYSVLAHAHNHAAHSVPKNNEAMYHLHFHEGEWRVAWPNQLAGWTTVTAKVDYRAVVFLHSHHSMPALFSPQDDAEDDITMIFGVIGEIYDNNPQITLRVGVEGDYLYIPVTDLFDDWGIFWNPMNLTGDLQQSTQRGL